MGSLYRPKYRGADGVVRESAVYWLKYRDALKVLRRESSGTEKEQEARRLLKRREGASVEGRLVMPQADRVTLKELAENLKTDYETNGRRTVVRMGTACGICWRRTVRLRIDGRSRSRGPTSRRTRSGARRSATKRGGRPRMGR